jgi:hypothetical protein
MKLLQTSKLGRSGLLSFTVLFTLTGAGLSSAAAEPVLNPINGHYYELLETSSALNWYEAGAAAGALEYKGLPGYLATITTVEEQEFVVNQFPQALPEFVWLGGSDADSEGVFRWATGEVGLLIGIAGLYENWSVGEPNGGTSENCVGILDGSITWGDENCDRSLNVYLVEYSRPILHTVHCGGGSGSGTPFFDVYGLIPRLQLVVDEGNECLGSRVDTIFGDITVPFSDVPQYLEANRARYANFDAFVDTLTDGNHCLEVMSDVVDIVGDIQITGGGCGYAPIDIQGAEIDSIELLAGDGNVFSWEQNEQFFRRQHDFTVTLYGPALVTNVDVGIDIKPGNNRNQINPRSKGVIWVALLSDTASPFDPSSQVDIPTVEFGPDSATANRYKVKDINKDGLGDLLLRFKVPDTGIACGDTEATLTGETFGGQPITSSDAITTVGCR